MCGYAIGWNSPLEWGAIKHRGIGISRNHPKFKPEGIDQLSIIHYKLPMQTKIEDFSDQPITLQNGNMLLFVGEIFNHPKEFESDTEYLKSFFGGQDWFSKIGGEDYNTWDGFWSISIITPEGVYSFTDPLGQKQLYFSSEGLSSEIKTLLTGSRKPDLNLKFNFTDPEVNELTPFLGIYRMIPNLLYFIPFDKDFKEKGPEVLLSNLFKLRKSQESKPSPKKLRELIMEAVDSRIHRKPNGKLGPLNTLFLSGGLDSTIILACIHQLGELDNFEFLSLDNGDDNKYVDLLEDKYDITIYRLPSRNFDDLSPRIKEFILYHYESTIEKGSLVPNFILCSNSRTRSILTGDGADELFSGYKRAQERDTQEFDVFTELPFYHNIRLDRMGMSFTREVRCPFMSHEVVRFALSCPYELRKGKAILKEAFPEIPLEIQNRKKEPLRSDSMRASKKQHQSQIFKSFIKTFKF